MKFTVRLLNVVLLLLLSCTSDLTELQFKKADEYLRRGQYKQSIEEYIKVVNYNKNKKPALRALKQMALIYENYLRDHERAILTYRDLLKKTEEDEIRLDAHKSIARIYAEKLGNAALAEEEFRSLSDSKIRMKDSERAQLYLDWAKALMDLKEYKKALAVYAEFKKAFNAHIMYSRVLLLEGQAYLALRDGESAEKLFKEALSVFELNPDFSDYIGEAQFGIGEALEIQDKLTEAIEYYEKAKSSYPNPGVVKIKLEKIIQRKAKKK